MEGDRQTRAAKIAHLDSISGEPLRIIDVRAVGKDAEEVFSWSIDPLSLNSIEVRAARLTDEMAVRAGRVRYYLRAKGRWHPGARCFANVRRVYVKRRRGLRDKNTLMQVASRQVESMEVVR